jgi:hypothetical protein
MVALPKVSEGNSTLSKCPRKTVALQDDLADKEEDNWTVHCGLYGSSSTTSALGSTCRQCKGEAWAWKIDHFFWIERSFSLLVTIIQFILAVKGPSYLSISVSN